MQRRRPRFPILTALLAVAALAVTGCAIEDGDEAAETVVRETVVEEDGREVVPEDDGYRIVVDTDDGTVEVDEDAIEVDVETDDDPPGHATEPPGRARGWDKDGVDDGGSGDG